MLAQRRGFFRIRQGVQLEGEAPGEPAAQIGAQCELRRCGVAARDQGAGVGAHAIVQIEQPDLIVRRQLLHVVHGDQRAPGGAEVRCAAEILRFAWARRLRQAAQQVRAAAARFAPEVDEALGASAAGDIAQRLQCGAVAPRDEVFQCRRGRRRELQEQLLHHLYRLLLRYWPPRWRRPTSRAALAGRASSTPKKPKIWPKASRAKITATGCRPMRLPTRKGVPSVASSVWPTANTIHTGTTAPMLGNCISATTVASTNPVSTPT